MHANSRIEFLAPDYAIHHAYYFTLARTGEGVGAPTAIVDTGSSTDELRKVDGAWLIVRREVTAGP
jgi:hypothetical protein